VHQGGRAGADPLDRELAAAGLVGAAYLRMELGIEQLEHLRIGIAELEQRLGLAWNDALLARVERHSSGGPHGARTADLREALIDRRQQPQQLAAGVAAPRHRRGAGVVLLAEHGEAVLPDGDDSRHYPDLQLFALQRIALLDMRLEE